MHAQGKSDNAKANSLTWHTDVKEVSSNKVKKNKPLLLFFTGSDWCGWCIKLQNEVLKTMISKMAAENVVL
jgi:protein disulfide-isomerase